MYPEKNDGGMMQMARDWILQLHAHVYTLRKNTIESATKTIEEVNVNNFLMKTLNLCP